MYNKRFLQICSITVAMLFVVRICAFAIPSSDEINVVSGEVNIQHADQSLTFNVQSDKAIINMNSFSVGASETVTFNGPNSEVLARVTGGAPSHIDGALFSDLQILAFVNENGIHIGPEARIEVANIIMSTRNITDSNFVNGDYIFEKLSKEAQDMLLLNEGEIRIHDGGFGVLIAGAVENRGLITATAGKIVLAGGDCVKLDISSNGLISVAIDAKTASKIYDYHGNSVLDQIKNSGVIMGDGSLVLLQAESLTDIFRSTINLEGYITTTCIEENDGCVRIVADGDVNLNCDITSVKVDAVSDEDMMSYGRIKATGGDITLTADADKDGKGEFHQMAGTIEAEGEGDIFIDGSGEMTITSVKVETGTINIGTKVTPEVVKTSDPDIVNTEGKEVIIQVEENVEIRSASETTHIIKEKGDLTVEEVLLIDAETISIIGRNFGRVDYYVHGNITLEVPRGDVNTSPGVILPGVQVKISALRIGSYVNPVGINADVTYINRLQGMIDITEMWGLGTTVTIRGPCPDEAGSHWGAVSYNSTSKLVLEAQKVTTSSSGPFSFIGDITFHNFYLTEPGKIIYFEPGKLYQFKGVTHIKGATGAGNIRLKSQIEGNPWFLRVAPEQYYISLVEVQDSFNLGLEDIYASPSVDKGNNAGWLLNTVYWIGAGGDNYWSTAANWTGDPSGQDVIFDGNTGTYANANKDSVINSAYTITSLNIQAGYTGEITQNDVVLTISNDYNQAGGTFQASEGTLKVGRHFYNSAGTLTLTGTHTLEFNGTTTQYAYIYAQTLSVNNLLLNSPDQLFYINGSSTSVLQVNGDVIFRDGLYAGTTSYYGCIDALGDVTVEGDWDGGYYGYITFSGAAPQTLTTNDMPFSPRIGINKDSGTDTVTLSGALEVVDLYMVEGIFDTGTNTFNMTRYYDQDGGTFRTLADTTKIGGKFTYSAGTFDIPSTHTLEFNGTSNHYVILTGQTLPISNLLINAPDVTLYMNGTSTSVLQVGGVAGSVGNLTLREGLYGSTTSYYGYIDVLGNVTVEPTWDGGNNGCIHFVGSGDKTFTTNDIAFTPLVIIEKDSGTDTVTVVGDLEYSSFILREGEFSEGSGPFNCVNLTIEGGSFTAGSSVVSV
ncbi:filamentous hemagglutinin N-terminal domain-containing protein, partial [Candidatus Omnitrophota bacterium]